MSRPRRAPSVQGLASREREIALNLGELAPQIVSGLADAVVVTGTDRRVLWANEAATRLFGIPLEELVGVHTRELVAEAERDHLAERQRRVFEGHEQRYDSRIVRRDGVERHVEVASTPMYDEGKLVGSAATLRDVTERKQAQDTLARSEARYRHLIESASDAIVTFDANGRFTTVNRAAEVISRYARDELVGQWFAPLLPDNELPNALRHFQQALAGETGVFETAFVRKDGELRHIAVTYSTPQVEEEVLCIIRDVTEQRQLQEQLIQSEKMGAVGQLVSGVAHELNNPLAAISAFAQLLLAEKRLPSEQRQSAETIYTESRRASRIVQNLLTFARQHPAEKSLTNVNQVLDDTLELRAYELKVHGIDFVREYDEAIPDTIADPYQLQQVFLNLITNAEQSMAEVERHPHRLTIRTRRQAEGIRIEIEDTGTGIKPSILDKIFNPFFTTKPTGTGTGLGLSISLGIVRQHDGRIWAENTPTGGARFLIEVPIVRARKSDETRALPAPPQARDQLRVLVVDDEPAVRLSLERYLQSQGHQVDSTGSGEEALTRCSGRVYDALLLDMRMPDLSGDQLYHRLRQRDPSLADRVVFMTGDLVSQAMRQFLTDSGRPYVAKPFEFAQIDAVLPGTRRMG